MLQKDKKIQTERHKQPCHVGSGAAINFTERVRSSEQRLPTLSIAFSMMTNFRMQAVNAIFGDFPADRKRMWNARNDGFSRTATRVLI